MTASLDDVVDELKLLRVNADERNELLARLDIRLQYIARTNATKEGQKNIDDELTQMREDNRTQWEVWSKSNVKALTIVGAVVTLVSTVLMGFLKYGVA